jgi:hypothetical protein
MAGEPPGPRADPLDGLMHVAPSVLQAQRVRGVGGGAASRAPPLPCPSEGAIPATDVGPGGASAGGVAARSGGGRAARRRISAAAHTMSDGSCGASAPGGDDSELGTLTDTAGAHSHDGVAVAAAPDTAGPGPLLPPIHRAHHTGSGRAAVVLVSESALVERESTGRCRGMFDMCCVVTGAGQVSLRQWPLPDARTVPASSRGVRWVSASVVVRAHILPVMAGTQQNPLSLTLHHVVQPPQANQDAPV